MTPADPFDPEAPDADAVRALADLPPVPPPADLLARILDRLPAAVTFVPADPSAFHPTRHPGVTARLLHLDRPAGRFSAFLRLAPGAVLPAHAHDGAEECVVLDGTLTVGDRVMGVGDYQRADPGSPHAEQRSPAGCLLFLSGPVSLMGG